MKKTYLFAFILATLAAPLYGSAQIKFPQVLKKGSSGNVTEGEAGQGVKEALTQGVLNAVLNLNKTDGFFGSNVYKMFLPEDAQKIEKTLRAAGMGAQVDKAILAINRGAEDAVAYAKPIFLDAIKQITVTDALKLVSGQKDAITQFFKSKTTTQLTAAFRPSVQSSLEKVNATKYYTDIVTSYNNFPTTFKKINPDLTGYVVDKAVAALFDQVAQEEAKIRANPMGQASDILKKVFGK
ncbi:DUF4197 domain-containing protein [Nostoc ellipsosporum NOK]|jgi:hypothetical protein|nr:DUF4197 domain-containing protein [Nostoc ellipsosporum NOK]